MITYHQYDARALLSAPQFVRMRSRYRGPRESYKFNLESQQFLYDVRRLLARYTGMAGIFKTDVSWIEDGGTVPGVTPGDLLGLNVLSERAAALSNRLRKLEGRA